MKIAFAAGQGSGQGLDQLVLVQDLSWHKEPRLPCVAEPRVVAQLSLYIIPPIAQPNVITAYRFCIRPLATIDLEW